MSNPPVCKLHVHEMVGAFETTGWSCTQEEHGKPHGIHVDAIVACMVCGSGWCVDHIPEERP